MDDPNYAPELAGNTLSLLRRHAAAHQLRLAFSFEETAARRHAAGGQFDNKI
jgi:hypothetical protein